MIRAITFDCYGTLVDWERGIYDFVAPILATSRGAKYDERPKIAFADWLRFWEAEQFALLSPYRPYREVLTLSFASTMRHFLLESFADDGGAFVRSLAKWPIYDDVQASLRKLARRYRLGVISNIDDELLADSVGKMAAPFSLLMTAEQAQSYKPERAIFDLAIARLGVAPSEILHVAFGRKYDLAAARAVGMRTCWLQRPSTIAEPTAIDPATDSAADETAVSLAALTAALVA